MAENKIQKSHLINMLTLIIHTSTFTIINQTNHTYSTKLIQSLKGRRKGKLQNHIQTEKHKRVKHQEYWKPSIHLKFNPNFQITNQKFIKSEKGRIFKCLKHPKLTNPIPNFGFPLSLTQKFKEKV